MTKLRANSPYHADELFVGIDGGGTKCKARLENEKGELLSEATTGPANASRDLDASIANIIRACELCLSKAELAPQKLSELKVGMGLAGINLPEVKQAFSQRTLPFADYKCTTDLHIACLGAHQGQDGTIIIVGTGSSGIAVSKGSHVIMGGHGFQVGDKGSGAWIGKMAVSHCLETRDGIVHDNELAHAVMNTLGCSNTIELVSLAVSAPPAFFAKLSPMVFELAQAKEPQAHTIITEAANYISQLSHNLLQHSPSRLAYIGGVSGPLIPYLDKALQSQLSTPLSPPEQGAIYLIKSKTFIESHS